MTERHKMSEYNEQYAQSYLDLLNKELVEIMDLLRNREISKRLFCDLEEYITAASIHMHTASKFYDRYLESLKSSLVEEEEENEV